MYIIHTHVDGDSGNPKAYQGMMIHQLGDPTIGLRYATGWGPNVIFVGVSPHH